MRIAIHVASGLFLSLSLVGCGATQVLETADDGRAILIRAPQVDEDDLRDLDRDYDVRTVVNLRGRAVSERWYRSESRGVRAIGARWEQLSTSGRSAPSPEHVARFLDLVEDPRNWPIVMHCQGGVHRTGVMAALYRIQYQSWPAEKAIAEMEDLGFDWTIHDRDALKRFLRSYRRDPTRSIPRGLAAITAAPATAAVTPADSPETAAPAAGPAAPQPEPTSTASASLLGG